MKYIISGIGSGGDVNPSLQLGVSLQKRGHEIHFLAMEGVKDRAEKLGFQFHAVVSQKQHSAYMALPPTSDVDLENQRAFVRLGFPAIRPTVDYITECYEAGNTVLVGTNNSIGLKIAEELFNIPFVMLSYAPMCWEAVRAEKQRGESFDSLLLPLLNRIREHYGLHHLHEDALDWLSSCIIDRIGLYPNWFMHITGMRSLGDEIPTHYLFNDEDDISGLPDALVNFLASGAKPIGFTFGTYSSARADLFQTACDAALVLNLRAIFLTPYAHQIPQDLPDSILHVPYASFRNLFPHLQVIVHHAGAGTIAQAFRAGIPQLVCPMAFDQFENAARVEALGAGLRITRDSFEVNSVVDKIRQLVQDESFDNASKTLSYNFQSISAVDRVCDVLEDHGQRIKAMTSKKT